MVVAAVAVLLGLALRALGIPSALLFAGLLAGLVRALAVGPATGVAALPPSLVTGSHAVMGVMIGALLTVGTLQTVAANWFGILLVVAATLALSVGAGLLLRLHPAITPVTGVFAMVAGGASGIIVMARELGADERLVAVLQYLRVLLIVLLMPVAAAVFFGASSGRVAPPSLDASGWAAGALLTLGCAAVGLVVGRLSRLPVATLLGPMLVAAAANLSGLSHGAQVPGALGAAAFLVIGIDVGLSFTRASLRTIGATLPLATGLIIALIVTCAGLGMVLSRVTGVSPLEGYLATTPGGLYAVLATATDSEADAVFVLAVQVLRLFVMLLTAPLLARWLGGHPRGRGPRP